MDNERRPVPARDDVTAPIADPEAGYDPVRANSAVHDTGHTADGGAARPRPDRGGLLLQCVLIAP